VLRSVVGIRRVPARGGGGTARVRVPVVAVLHVHARLTEKVPCGLVWTAKYNGQNLPKEVQDKFVRFAPRFRADLDARVSARWWGPVPRAHALRPG